MIDQDKMRALAAKLRGWNWLNDPVPQEAADAIDLLLAEVEAMKALMIDMREAMNNGLFWAEVPELRARFAALAQRQGEGS